MSTAYFAGGCFWCIASVFQETDGVSSVVSGYSGGSEADPKYEDVKAQRTGHRETIKIEYDSRCISYAAMFDLFLDVVDPFDGEGQFIDRGHSYSLAVYYTSEEERLCALEKLTALEKLSGRRVFVSVEPFSIFYDAEEYHQDYYLKHPEDFHRELIESGRLKESGNN